MTRVRHITSLARLAQLPPDERRRLAPVAERFAFRVNDYYIGLIDWDDPRDPLRRLVVPHEQELTEWGELDASHEAHYTPVRGCQHKYSDTALLLVNEVCGAYCRYCFRKRLFMNDNDDASLDYRPGLHYIQEHEEITNVLLTGGDPLILSTKRIERILSDVTAVPHVRIVRIGSKMLAFNPFRVLDDPGLVELLAEYCRSGMRIYVMNHFDHPRELTSEAREAMGRLLGAGVGIVNQCPIIRGVNDRAATLAALFRELSFAACPPYYVFQGRPTAGNLPFEVPLVEGWHLFTDAQRRVSGLAKRARFVMSHASGKIEVVGVDDEHVYMRYHRAQREEDFGKMVIAVRDDKAYWLDQLTLVSGPRSAWRYAANPDGRPLAGRRYAGRRPRAPGQPSS
ncbi:MAG TPA: KamA family radical SAM protein [Gemmatimonadales bacterium]